MRYLTLNIFLIISSISVFGQVQLGIKSGYNYSFPINKTPAGSKTSYTINQNSWIVAVSIRERAQRIFNIGFEVEYITHSFFVDSKWGGPNTGNHAQYSYSIGYINLYLLPQIVFGKKPTGFIYIGPYVGQLLYSKINGTIDIWHGTTTHSDTLNGKATKDFVNTDFGIAIGGGIDIPIYKRLNFLIETTSSIGLRNLSTAWSTDFFNFLNIKIEIGFTYNFGNRGLFTKN